MKTEIQRRRNPNKSKPKKTISLSLSGDEGYEALEVLNGTNHIFGKSGLVIDLTRYFKELKEFYGLNHMKDEEIITYLTLKLEMEKSKSNTN